MAVTRKRANAVDDALEAVSKEAARAEAAHEKLVAREEKAREQLEATRARTRGSKSKRSTDALRAAKQRVEEATRLRKESAARLRETKKLVREETQLAREAERKERARERAVAAFLKKWEREYDLEMRRKQKNIELRRRELQRR